MSFGVVQAEKMTTESGYSLGAGNASSFKNRIINPGMVIDQRNAGASVTANDGVFAVDRFRFSMTQSSKGTGQRSSTAPAGFTNSLLFTSSAATSVGSSDQFAVVQPIEGYNIADLGWGAAGAKSVTLSFWVRSSLTGTFGGALQNQSANRSYPFTYTITTANTWELETITVPGDTTGTWDTTNSGGIRVFFGLGMGSTFSGTANAWAGANYQSATGATSVVSTNGAAFYITGVQLEVGTVATSFDFRSYGAELALCQRYAYVQSGVAGDRCGFGYCGTATLFNLVVPLPVTMRTAPTLTSCSPIQVNDNNSGYNSSAITIGDQITNTCVNLKVTSSGMTIGRGAQAYWSPSAGSMILSAEL